MNQKILDNVESSKNAQIEKLKLQIQDLEKSNKNLKDVAKYHQKTYE